MLKKILLVVFCSFLIIEVSLANSDTSLILLNTNKNIEETRPQPLTKI